MNIIPYILSAIIISSTSGCMSTNALRNKIDLESSSIREFVDFEARGTEYRGEFRGSTNINGNAYFHYAFQGPLKGAVSRTLLLFAPQNDYTNGIVTESLHDNISKTNATLIIATSDSPSLPSLWMFNRQWELHDPKEDRSVIVLNRRNTYRGDENNRDQWTLFVAIPKTGPYSDRWKVVTTENQISWHIRNPSAIPRLKRWQYFTVPFDIVTFPIQAIYGVGYMIYYVEKSQ